MKKLWKKHKAAIIIGAVVVILILTGVIRKVADPHAGHDHEANPHTTAISVNI